MADWTTIGPPAVGGTDGALGGSGGTPLSQTLVDAVMPWSVDINPFMTAAAKVGTFTLLYNQTGLAYQTLIYNSSGAQNDAIAFDRTLAAGTWELEVLGDTGTNYGIITMQIDGSAACTVDRYSGSAGHNVISTASFTVATTGKKRLNFIVLTRNASNTTGWFESFQWITLRRTA